jgi:hypothetical protein
MSEPQVRELFSRSRNRLEPRELILRNAALVGVLGFADTKHLHAALEYLAIPESQWKVMIEDSVLVSVRALAYMHKIRYSGADRWSTMDIGDVPAACTKNIGKRRRPTTKSMDETRRRWDNLADSIRRRSRGRTQPGDGIE